LTFHSIDASGSVLSFNERLFDALLAELRRKAIPICDLDSLLSSEVNSGVAITFDDGMKSVYRNALPVLKKHQAPAHVFLATSPFETNCVP
jgi:peptidoglycan/xylan/chitin deacetylase (PgdA/CDA1 family)